MRSLTLIILFLGLCAAGVQAEETTQDKSTEPNVPQEQPDVNTIVKKANFAAYYQGEDGKARVRMTITNKQGQERNSEFIIMRKDMTDGGNQKYYVYFERPADVRRMVYMVHKHTALDKDDDRWLYMPGLDLVKRIAASDKRTSFVGSHFLYEDVSGRSIELDEHQLIKTTEDYFIIKNTPKKPDLVEFKYYDVSIDKKTYLPMKIEYYNEDNKLYRVIEALKVEEIQGFPTPVKSEVRDLESGGKTLMEYSDVQYNIDIGDIFTERYLRRPPREVRR